MKKALKIAGIAVGSFLAFFLIIVCVLCFIVFSPSRLTPMVQKYASEFVKCEYNIGEADLTFFSTFPDFGIHVKDVRLVNPCPGAQSDTLLNVNDLYASIQILEFLRYGAVVVNDVALEDGYANIFIENDSVNNFSVFDFGEEEEEEDTTSVIKYIGLSLLELDNVNATYVDRQMHIDASLKALDMKAHGRFFAEEESFDMQLKMKAEAVRMNYSDSTRIDFTTNNLSLDAEGMMEVKHFDGEVKLQLPETMFALNGDTLVNRHNITLSLPADFNLQYMYANLHEGTQIAVDENEVSLQGKVELCDNSDIYMSLNFETNQWNLERTIELVPAAYRSLVSDYDIKGDFRLKGKANGTLSDDNFPLIFCDLILDNCSAKVPQLPYNLHDVNADIYADVNLNSGYATDVTIRTLSAEADDMKVGLSGRVTDVLGAMNCDVKLTGHLPLTTLQKVLPNSLPLNMSGTTDIDLKAQFALADVTGLKLNRIKANGHIEYQQLDVLYNDSIHIIDNKGSVDIALPSPASNKMFHELGQVKLKGENLKIDMTDGVNAVAINPDVRVGFGDILNDKQPLQADCRLRFENLSAKMGNSLVAQMGNTEFSGFTSYNEKEENLLLKLNPTLKVNLTDGFLQMAGLEYPINIPKIKFNFTPERLEIDNSRIVLGNSDFNLSGEITDIRGFAEKKELLRGDLNFTSDRTDVDQIMAIVNGFGNEQTEEAEEVKDDNSDPFMVPKRVKISLNTNIKNAIFNQKNLRDLSGKLTVNDGVLLAEQMGFTSDAAEMQLTAIYRSQRCNHLFCGIDFHLLKIDIHELIDLIPSIDTIVPMLKSFDGKAEFHFAGETYLNAKYEPKMSTLRGAAALEGRDLVVMDNETFSTIAKYLMFKKSTRNVIDSLSVEATIFQNEIDVYPFLVSMDRWQAVLAGRHNLDMSFNYHISLTDCPLPVRLGLNISGTFDKPKFKLADCQYRALFKPDRRGATEEQTMKLKKQISDALKANVK